MDPVSEKFQIRVFLVGRRYRRGGVFLEKKLDMKALRLDLVLVYYLDETGEPMKKIDHVSGCEEMCGILV